VTNGIAFYEFPEKRTNLRGKPNFSEISYREFAFHLTSSLNFRLDGSLFGNSTTFGFAETFRNFGIFG